jgi:hypothetical protein|nr:MAG TPA: hypothetical protein [Caudoviricetes sp.]
MEKELLWNVLGYVVSLVVYLVLKWRYEGREAVNREAIEQELAIQGKGLGELKKKAVQEFVSKLPTHLRIFINETTIDAVVKELQPIFKRMKEGKNGDYKA